MLVAAIMTFSLMELIPSYYILFLVICIGNLLLHYVLYTMMLSILVMGLDISLTTF